MQMSISVKCKANSMYIEIWRR